MLTRAEILQFMKYNRRILAIDTSCDDTSAAVTEGVTVLSNVVASQAELHKQYGGVFPTVAKLAHRENIAPTIKLALKRAHLSMAEIDAVAVTHGPGLAPALEVGLTAAKELARDHHKPLIPINHIEGHLLSVLAQPQSVKSDAKSVSETQFPVLALIVSGKQTQFVLVHTIGKYEVLGSSLDDAAGECLDKVGRMVNLGYPAGPLIEQFAKKGNPKAIAFPLPLTHLKSFDVSFSGLKTFARNYVEKRSVDSFTRQDIYDFCASIQYGVFRHIMYKLDKILAQYPIKELWLGGGVSANSTLRKELRTIGKKHGITTVRVPYTKRLCIDNAAMIGVVASFKQPASNLEIDRQPRLKLVSV
jgi:N6-L-threonylcarbamoyladenine synthase